MNKEFTAREMMDKVIELGGVIDTHNGSNSLIPLKEIGGICQLNNEKLGLMLEGVRYFSINNVFYDPVDNKVYLSTMSIGGVFWGSTFQKDGYKRYSESLSFESIDIREVAYNKIAFLDMIKNSLIDDMTEGNNGDMLTPEKMEKIDAEFKNTSDKLTDADVKALINAGEAATIQIPEGLSEEAVNTMFETTCNSICILMGDDVAKTIFTTQLKTAGEDVPEQLKNVLKRYLDNKFPGWEEEKEAA